MLTSRKRCSILEDAQPRPLWSLAELLFGEVWGCPVHELVFIEVDVGNGRAESRDADEEGEVVLHTPLALSCGPRSGGTWQIVHGATLVQFLERRSMVVPTGIPPAYNKHSPGIRKEFTIFSTHNFCRAMIVS